VAIILTGFTLLLLVDLVPVLRRRSWRTALAFLLFFLPALVLAVLRKNMAEVPSLLLFLGDVLKAWGVSY
jgi:hypothetical protein